MQAQCAFEETRQDRMAIVVTELPYQVNKAALVEKIADLVTGQEDRGHRRPARRVGPRRHAPGHRVQAGRQPAQGAQQPVQAHAAASWPSTPTCGARRRPAADAAAQGGPPAPHRLAPRGRPPAHRVRPRQGARPGAHPRGPQDRARQPRRGHRAPSASRPTWTTPAQNLIAALRPVRDPGQRHPRDAAAAPGRPRAQEDRGRVPRDHPAHRRAGGHPRQPARASWTSSRTSSTSWTRKYAGERRTRIADDAAARALDEDLIADEDVVVTVSGRGYIKRQPLATYRRQARGGKGIIGARTVEEDAVGHLLVANTHDWALFFTNRGRVFSSKVHASPGRQPPGQGHPDHQPRGRPGRGRRARPRGHHAAQLREGPQPGHGHPVAASSRRRPSSSSSASARRASGPSPSPRTTPWPGSASRPGEDDIVLATALGKIARFHESRGAAHGPRRGRRHRHPPGPRRATRSWAWASSSPSADILVLTETGYGKRVAADRVPDQASRRPGRPAHLAGGRQDRQRGRRRAGRPRPTRSCCSSAPAARSCAPTSSRINRYGSAGARRHRHAPQRGRHGGRHRRLPGRAGGAARRSTTMTTGPTARAARWT